MWDRGVTPNEFTAAHFLASVGGRSGPTEVATALGVSPATAKRALAGLVDKGLIERISRGHYRLCWMDLEGSPMTSEGSPMTLQGSGCDVYMTTSTSQYDCIEVPDGTSIQGVNPPQEVFHVKGFPVADDLPPGKLSLPPENKPRRRGNGATAMRGWREDPPEAWTVEHVAREFGMRLKDHNLAVPWNRLPMYYNGKELRAALLEAQRDHGVTVEQMVSAMDTFFAKPLRIRSGANFVGVFMTFMSDHLARSGKSTQEPITDEYIKQLEAEYASRPGWGADV